MTNAHALKAGDLCAFGTSPLTPFSESTTGRHAALKVLKANELIIFVVLDGVFDMQPALHQVTTLPPLHNQRFSFNGTLALQSTPRDWEIDLLGFTVLGNTKVTPNELALIPRFPPIGTWQGASAAAEGEWRWLHDREAVKQEIELDVAARETKRQAEQKRYETRLKHLTWNTLLAETMFARWTVSPPFPPPEFVDAVRARFHDAIVELQGMDPKPNKKETRRVLHRLVEQINLLDESYGHIVETEEREDLCAALGELASVACHLPLMEEVNRWRSW
jgi:hypothetical protein